MEMLLCVNIKMGPKLRFHLLVCCLFFSTQMNKDFQKESTALCNLCVCLRLNCIH